MSTPNSSLTYWNRVGPRILREVDRRLASHDTAKDLPGTLLMRLAELYLKHLDKQAAQQDDEQPYMSALEAVEQEGLSVELKIQILTDYISTQEGEIEKAKTRIAELQLEIIGGLSDIPPLQQS